MKQINLFFAVQVLRRKSGVYIFWKYFKKTVNGILNGGKILSERVLKNVCLRNTLFKYKLIKSMYEIITSLFVQKSLEAYHNSGTQPKKFFKKSAL